MLPNLSGNTGSKDVATLELPADGTVLTPSGTTRIYYSGESSEMPDHLAVTLVAVGRAAATDSPASGTDTGSESDAVATPEASPTSVPATPSPVGSTKVDSTEVPAVSLPPRVARSRLLSDTGAPGIDEATAGQDDSTATGTGDIAGQDDSAVEPEPSPEPTAAASPEASPQSSPVPTSAAGAGDTAGKDSEASSEPDSEESSGTNAGTAATSQIAGTATQWSAAWEIDHPFAFAGAATILLPDLAPGLYVLSCTATRNGSELVADTSLVFVEKSLPEITQVQLYPGVVKGGADALFYAQFDNIVNSGMFVRWESSSGTLAEQTIYGTSCQVQFKVPDRKGIYTYSLNLYPRLPQGLDFDFDAPVRQSFTVMVADKTMAGVNDLKPENDFALLLHLNGDIDDAGYLADTRPAAFELPGTQSFMLDDRHVGYKMGAGGYLSAGSVSMFRKSDGIDGGMAPLGVVLDLSFSSISAGTVFTTRTAGNDLALNLLMDDSGYLVAEFRYGTTVASLKSRVQATSGAHRLYLGAGLNNGNLDLVLAVNGELWGQALQPVGSQFAVPQALLDADDGTWLPGRTAVGALEGPQFILDEFGIHAPADLATVMDSYYRSMRFSWGSALVLAESFVAPLLKNLQVDGDIRLGNGKLLIPQGASIRLPFPALGSKELALSLGFADGNKGDAVLTLQSEDQAAPPVQVHASGRISQGTQAVSFQPDARSLEVRLSRHKTGPAQLDVRVGKALLTATFGAIDGGLEIVLGANQQVLAEVQVDYLLALFKELL